MLGIIEVDYLGLQYLGQKGEMLWINMRNQIKQQMTSANTPPYRFQLKVKFFVPPHLLLQEVTRYVSTYPLLHCSALYSVDAVLLPQPLCVCPYTIICYSNFITHLMYESSFLWKIGCPDHYQSGYTVSRTHLLSLLPASS